MPLLWASYEDGNLFRSRDQLEEELCCCCRASWFPGRCWWWCWATGASAVRSWPAGVKTWVFTLCRICPDVWIQCKRYQDNLRDYPIAKGKCHVLREVRYRKSRSMRQHVVVCWERGLAKRRDEPVFFDV